MNTKIKMTDDGGHFWLNGKLYKVKKYSRTSREEMLRGVHNFEYEEVNPEEYDKRIEELVGKIVSFPGVDLRDVLRDALYDMTLDHLDILEKKLSKEVTEAREGAREPKVETKRGERGTCVELRIGGKYGMQLRM